VDVIPFPVWPVYCYVDGDGENAIIRWLDENGVSSQMRGTLQSFIEIVQYNDPSAVPGVIVQISKDLEAFRGVRKGEQPVFLIFCRSVYTDCEITLLNASRAPRESLADARSNLETIRRDRRRRRYEPITRRLAGNLQG